MVDEEDAAPRSDEAAPEVAAVASLPTSPTGKVKFFCSHGGKILPRPSDGALKYVGGETRVVSVPRTISFSDLMKKISEMFDGEFVLKYQIGSEDLDALVTVKTDEDLCHMLEEYSRLETRGTSKLRTFLFPAKLTTITIDSSLQHNPQHMFPPSIPLSLEQRYFDAINGVIRSTPSAVNVYGRNPVLQSRLKSVCSSPSEGGSPNSSLSPRSMINQNPNYNPSVSPSPDNTTNFSLHGRLPGMHKVHSSPSLCSLGGGTHQNIDTQMSNNFQAQLGRLYPYSQYSHQQQQQQYYHQPQVPPHNLSGYRFPGGPPLQPEHHHTEGWGSFGRDDHGRVSSGSNLNHGQMGFPTPGSYSMMRKGYMGSGGQNRWAHLGQ